MMEIDVVIDADLDRLGDDDGDEQFDYEMNDGSDQNDDDVDVGENHYERDV